MNTINTNPQQNTSSETVKNIVDMFNQLTPDNKDTLILARSVCIGCAASLCMR